MCGGMAFFSEKNKRSKKKIQKKKRSIIRSTQTNSRDKDCLSSRFGRLDLQYSSTTK